MSEPTSCRCVAPPWRPASPSGRSSSPSGKASWSGGCCAWRSRRWGPAVSSSSVLTTPYADTSPQPDPFTEALLRALPGGDPWEQMARPAQRAPAGDWLVWLMLAGRGFGKTRSGAEWAKQQAQAMPGSRGALIAAKFADGRDTMVEGESGLLTILPPSALRGGVRERSEE